MARVFDTSINFVCGGHARTKYWILCCNHVPIARLESTNAIIFAATMTTANAGGQCTKLILSDDNNNTATRWNEKDNRSEFELMSVVWVCARVHAWWQNREEYIDCAAGHFSLGGGTATVLFYDAQFAVMLHWFSLTIGTAASQHCSLQLVVLTAIVIIKILLEIKTN